MDCYDIWVNLAPGVRDLDFVDAVHGFLGHLKSRGEIESYRIRRRKFGFSPEGLGEFSIGIECQNLEQLDKAFHHAATRSAEIEPLHAAVFSRVTDFKSALYRDFPDPERER